MLWTPRCRIPPQDQETHEQGKDRKQVLSLPAPPMKKRPRFLNCVTFQEENVIFKPLAPSLFLPDIMESMAFDDEKNGSNSGDEKENLSLPLSLLKLKPQPAQNACFSPSAAITEILKHHPPKAMPQFTGFQPMNINTQKL